VHTTAPAKPRQSSIWADACADATPSRRTSAMPVACRTRQG
jgi:hypothetical protein